MTVNEWIEQNYENILLWAKNAAQQHDDYNDLAHYAITVFLEHEKAQDLIDRHEARFFIVRILLNSSRGKKSEYYRKYRPNHDSTDVFPDSEDEEYDLVQDQLTETIKGILEDLSHGDNEEWFRATITQLCIQQEKLNFSKLARETGIPRTTISSAYNETLIYIKNKINEYRKYNPNIIGDGLNDNVDPTN